MYPEGSPGLARGDQHRTRFGVVGQNMGLDTFAIAGVFLFRGPPAC